LLEGIIRSATDYAIISLDAQTASQFGSMLRHGWLGKRSAAEPLMAQLRLGHMAALIRRAKAGYAVPLQLVFERLAPPRKDRHIMIPLPAITNLGDVLAAQGAIIQCAAAGELTPSEAQSMAALLDLRRRTIESIATARSLSEPEPLGDFFVGAPIPT